MIDEAEIKLHGLTVIAGENDTGKSTIGKTVFAVSKALNNYNVDFEQDRIDFALRNMEQIYFFLRRNVDYSENRELQELFSVRNFHEELIKFGDDRYRFDSLMRDRIYGIDRFIPNDDARKTRYIQLLEEISKQFDVEDESYIIKSNISKIMGLEFGGQVTNNRLGDYAELEFSEGRNFILGMAMTNKKVEHFDIVDEFSFRDATYIETPFVLQYKDMLMNNRTSSSVYGYNRRNSKVPFHTTDLIEKIQLSENVEEDYLIDDWFYDNNRNRELMFRIRDIIKGNIQYDKKRKDYVFVKDNGYTKSLFRSDNTASGIKSFGLIQMLLNSSVINSRSLLIIDEPEVHLHPKWQVEYAQIIVELVRIGTPVLVNTHSPYILQAIKYYSKDLENSGIVNYYLADNHYDDSVTKISDVTDSLYIAFKKLSDPIQDLVWY